MMNVFIFTIQDLGPALVALPGPARSAPAAAASGSAIAPVMLFLSWHPCNNGTATAASRKWRNW
ncbi:hypothetical protein [Xanthomonas arboricola]|uniref:hypothetical protein n=1 Tax=Xanthomonas arboricola TaxID=56448 RepID=UPI00129029E9|nr:hypothetical protein [Xanthomonas arboricola]